MKEVKKKKNMQEYTRHCKVTKILLYQMYIRKFYSSHRGV